MGTATFNTKTPHSRSNWPFQQHWTTVRMWRVTYRNFFSCSLFIYILHHPTFRFRSAFQLRSAISAVAKLFSFCDRELRPMTLTFKPDLHGAKRTQHIHRTDFRFLLGPLKGKNCTLSVRFRSTTVEKYDSRPLVLSAGLRLGMNDKGRLVWHTVFKPSENRDNVIMLTSL